MSQRGSSISASLVVTGLPKRKSDVVSLGELRYSKATANPVKVVVAVASDSPAKSVTDLGHGVRVSTEYPVMTRKFFAERGVTADIRLSYGRERSKDSRHRRLCG